jgi:nitrogen fixation protein FixH
MNTNKPFKFHWGHGIILTFILFGGFMAYFYIHMTHENIDLVGKQYYQEGQNFQEKINERNEANQLGLEKPGYEFSEDFQTLSITYPRVTQKISLVFYRPSDAKLDQQINLSKLSSDFQIVKTSFLKKGPWNLSIHWVQDNHKYQEDHRIYVP